MMVRRLLEVCVADVESLDAAVAGGADRIELCSALEVGGLTPSPGLIARAAALPIPVYAMVRPRSGDFVYSTADTSLMLADIAAIRQAGLAGVVLGASNPDSTLDVATLEKLMMASEGLGTNLHRAFDLVPDIDAAIETVVSLGFERILSAGRQSNAIEGLSDIEHAFDIANGRVSIMPGAGITTENVATILDRVPVTELHASCGTPRKQNHRAVEIGVSDPTLRRTSAKEVQTLKQKLSA
jgi:copper homeostasis protein